MNNLAIVIVPSVPYIPTPTPRNPGCDYQVRIGGGVYKCYTTQQYKSYLSNRSFVEAHTDLVAIGIIVLLIVVLLAWLSYVLRPGKS